VTIWLHFANKGAGALTTSNQGCTQGKSVRARLSAWFAPVFFFQDRPGKNAKIFKVIKFKTMTDERDENGYGYWCESVKPEDFTALVDKMLKIDRKAMGERGYEFLKQNYTVQNTYDAIMKHL
jgi:hypothetical protein